MNAPSNPLNLIVEEVEFELNGNIVKGFSGETILQAAKRTGVDIPHLCYKEGYRPDGNCRACVVEIKGERTLAPSCCRNVTANMVVSSDNERVTKSQKMVLELLLSDMPKDGFKWLEGKEDSQHGELSDWANRLQVKVRPELESLKRPSIHSDASHPAMLVNLDACIQCNRCVRACREEQVNDVIGYAMRGAHSEIVFDLDVSMGDSTCVACGECVQACPTGALSPPGNAKPDLWIIQQLAKGMGLDWLYAGEESGVAAVYEEMRQAMHAVISGISWDRLEKESSVTYPCLTEDDPGQPTVFIEQFATMDGRVNLVPADIIPADESPDQEFPFVLITGRQLEHWHTGSMTRRATVLDSIEPIATVSMNGEDIAKLGVQPGDIVTVQSRRGEVVIHVRRDDGTPTGSIFIPFAYYEAAANLMTNAALDPFGKIPEFKYCAVRVIAGGDVFKKPGYDTNKPVFNF
jgi:predicted molibdopterin-dependent oxidoreductase YjgC